MNNINNLKASILLISTVAFGQVEKKVGDLNKVTSFDRIDVVLVQSDQNKVVLQGKDANEVELVNKNGELKIRMPLTKILDGDNISVTVYFKNIEAVEANEGSCISCSNKLNATAFNIIAKEGSEVKLILDVSKLNVRVANGSKIVVEGTAQNQEVLVNSGGIYEAQNFKTAQTTITGNAGGEAEIYATELVEAKIRAGGDILIYGKPKQINQKVIAGGSISEAR
jgi:hypothetical protein